jgi:hypothetical protein
VITKPERMHTLRPNLRKIIFLPYNKVHARAEECDVPVVYVSTCA